MNDAATLRRMIEEARQVAVFTGGVPIIIWPQQELSGHQNSLDTLGLGSLAGIFGARRP